MTVTINRKSGEAPREVVEALVTGQAYPFQATLTHRNTFALVVPSTGYPDVIKPGEVGQVRIRDFGQAWALVTDLAQLAESANNDADEYAVITPDIDTTPKQKTPRKAAAALADASEAV